VTGKQQIDLPKKEQNVRRLSIPGNTSSLWKVVKITKDVNFTSLPKVLFGNREEIPTDLILDKFAKFFNVKISNLLQEVPIDEDMFDGNKKLYSVNKMSMT
jgi:hypothetical protein